MKPISLTIALIIISSYLPVCLASGSVNETRNALREWVQTQQIISREKSEAQFRKEILLDTVELLNAQLRNLKDKLAELEDSGTVADAEREALLSDNTRLKDASTTLEKGITALEQQVLSLAPSFPQPLLETIDPLLRRISKPNNTTKASLGERAQNIVGILSQADRFNTKVTLVKRTQTLSDGREVQVSTIYWGLGQAYFVDNTDTYSGIGYPTADGWIFEEVSGIAPSVRELVSTYLGETDEVRFVHLPARIR